MQVFHSATYVSSVMGGRAGRGLICALWTFAVLFSGTSIAADGGETEHAQQGLEGHTQKHHHNGGDSATTTHRFDDVERWSSIFDAPDRDDWQKPDVLIKALKLGAGHIVADIGAGTGHLNKPLAAAVGPSGAVLAVDVEPNLIAHMRTRAEKESTANVIPILASYDNPRLPPASVDLVLLVDTFHHIDGRVQYFGRLKKSLKKGGRVVVVDFFKRELPVGPPLKHKIDMNQVAMELQEAGYAIESKDQKSLPYQYIVTARAE